MNKTFRTILIFLVIGIVVIGGYFVFKSLLTGNQKSKSSGYEWVTIDQNYAPKDYVEEFIKNDSETKGLFPVYIRNYGKNTSILKKFKGQNLVSPNEGVLKMMFQGMEDWMLVDLKYKNEKGREVRRTILYVQVEGNWKVGDSGRLMEKE
jgi:hypothetical protein